ncbi:MAG: type II secretion system F family protein [Candidatus Hydrogenedentes bacterium]|nr:type II secretion system F family protein [Candidatus Hydrogenedentota bacterium]
MYEAGIPLARCFELLAETRDRNLRDLARRIRDDLEHGATFAEAVRARSRVLPRFFVEMIAAGEEAGALETVLQHLATEYETQIANRRALTLEVTYPLCIVAAALYVIPLFRMAMLGATAWQMGMFLARSLSGPLTLLALYSAFTHLKPTRASAPGTAGVIGRFSAIARALDMANALRAMAALFASGLSVPRCLEKTASLTTNSKLRSTLLNAIPLLRQGASLSEALATTRALSRDTLNLIAVGEQSGKLDTALKKASTLLRDAADHRLRIWLISLESILILLLGLAIVGGAL